MEALSSSETSVLIRANRRNVLENGILHSKIKFVLAVEAMVASKTHLWEGMTSWA
jgi:hypothetical protein